MNKHTLYYLERNSTMHAVHGIYIANKNLELAFYSYPSLWSLVQASAARLKSIGVEPGETVTLILPTCIDFVSYFFGAQLAGAIPVALYPPMNLGGMDIWQEKTEKLIKSVKGRVVITDSFIYQIAKNLSSEKISLFKVEELKNMDSALISSLADHYRETDICFYQFSSGTTGLPKPIIISQKSAINNAMSLLEAAQVKGPNKLRLLSWLPLYHDMGLVGNLILSIVNGSNFYLMRPDHFLKKPFHWLKLITKVKANAVGGPNFAYGYCVKRITAEQLKELDLSSIKVAINGAEFICKETIDNFCSKFESVGFNRDAFTPAYGLAENTLIATASMNKIKSLSICKTLLSKGIVEIKDDEANDTLTVVSLGSPMRETEIVILGEDDTALTDNRIGEVFIKSNSPCNGYFDNRQKQKIVNGYFATGDIGFIYDNELYICGRKKDIIIIRGRNYHPGMIEDKLYAISGIRKGKAVVSSYMKPNADTESLVVIAETHATKSNEMQEIKEQISLVLRDFQLPAPYIVLVEPGQLPRTSSGKIRRREAVDIFIHKKPTHISHNYIGKIAAFVNINALFLRNNIREKIQGLVSRT